MRILLLQKCSSLIQNCDNGIPSVKVCKVEDNFDITIYINPTLHAIVYVPAYKRVKKFRVNVKGSDCIDINAYDASADCRERCLVAPGKSNIWINLCRRLIGKDCSCNDSCYESVGNYMLIEIPYVDPVKIYITGGEVCLTNDLNVESLPKEVEVCNYDLELQDNYVGVIK